jgi:hypothetical protein
MAYETIPLKLFLAPSPKIIAAVDGGLTFFIGTGVAILGLVLAEKMGLKINKAAIRWSVRVAVCVFVLWAVLTSGLLRHLLFG